MKNEKLDSSFAVTFFAVAVVVNVAILAWG